MLISVMGQLLGGEIGVGSVHQGLFIKDFGRRARVRSKERY
jgi:hypothetical protein